MSLELINILFANYLFSVPEYKNLEKRNCFHKHRLRRDIIVKNANFLRNQILYTILSCKKRLIEGHFRKLNHE